KNCWQQCRLLSPRNSNSAATARSRRSSSRASGPAVPGHYLETSSAHPVQNHAAVLQRHHQDYGASSNPVC
ncbi:mCG145215, partial [Mus musculus]